MKSKLLRPRNKLKSRYRKLKVRRTTYILGARCRDGVVLVGDKKVGDKVTTEKIRRTEYFTDVVFAAAGLEGLFEDFLTEIPKRVLYRREMIRRKITDEQLPEYDYSLYHFKQDCVSLIKEMKESFCSEIQYDVPAVQVLFAVKNMETDKSELYYLDSLDCFSQQVKDKVVIGERYLANVILKSWKPEMTMEETARLGSFIIKYIEKEKLSDNVGVGNYQPDVWFVKDGKEPKKLRHDEVEKLLAGLDDRIEEIRKTVGSLSRFLRL